MPLTQANVLRHQRHAFLRTKLNRLAVAVFLAAVNAGWSQAVTFTKVTTEPIATDQGSFGGASWGDFFNNGRLDALVVDYAGGPNVFYRNDGGGV